MKRVLTHFKGDGLKAQLLKGVGGAAGLRLLNMPLMLLSSVLLARALGPENFGVYSFVLSLIALIGLPTRAGLPTLLIRETAKSHVQQNWALMNGLLKLSDRLVLVFSVVVVLLAGLAMHWFWTDADTTQGSTFLWALCLIPLLALANIRTGMLRGLRWVVISQVPEQIIRPAALICMLSIALLAGNSITAITAIQFNIAGAALAFVFAAYALTKARPATVRQAGASYTTRAWLMSLAPLSLFAGLRMLDTQSTILLLGVLGSAQEVGLFKVAATGAGLVAFGLSTINLAIAPQIARLFHAGEMAKLQRMITVTTRAATLISLPVTIIFVLWGEHLIRLLFGASYIAAAPALAIICVGQFINASCGSVALVLNMTGNDKATLNSAIIALLLNASLTALLVPVFGLVGAALGYTVSLSAWNIILALVTKRKTGLNTFVLQKQAQRPMP